MLRDGAEKISATVIAAFFAIDLALILAGDTRVDWGGYGSMTLIGLLSLAVGQFYRSVRPNERIALATTAAGLFILFTIAGSVFNYLLLPVGAERIDGFLVAVDASMGYSWPALVDWVASVPHLADALRLIYLSSLPQMVIVIVLLGFLQRNAQLDHFLLTGIFAALLTIAIWWIFPSSGASGFHTLADNLSAKLGIVVGTEYGTELNRILVEGVQIISPMDALGLIGFPSFHAVMACLCVWFMASVRPLFPLFIVVNALMIPAILFHGGHHLSDLLGGIIIFAVALKGSGMLLRSSLFGGRLSPIGLNQI